MKIRTEQVIDVYEWDKLVKETYKRPYNFQQQDGCKSRGVFRFSIPSDDCEFDYENDTLPEDNNSEEMGVSFAAWLARDPKQPIKDQEYNWELELWWIRNFYPSFDMVAADLYKKGLLEKGNYTISLDW